MALGPSLRSMSLLERRWIFVALAIGGLACRGTPIPGDCPPDREAIIASVRRWWAAWEAKDLGALEAMALEDYVEFTGNSAAPRIGRAALIAVARRAFQQATMTAWEVLDPVVRQEGNTAVVMYRWTEQAILGGRSTSAHGAATDVLVKKDGVWRYLSHHSTRLD